MEMKELVDLTQEELLTKEVALRKELFNLRFQLTSGRIESTAQIRHVKHDIARVKTVWRKNSLDKQLEKKAEGSK